MSSSTPAGRWNASLPARKNGLSGRTGRSTARSSSATPSKAARVVVIADTYFASNENLETAENSAADNIYFWRWLLSRVVPGQKPWDPPPNVEKAAPAKSGARKRSRRVTRNRVARRPRRTKGTKFDRHGDILNQVVCGKGTMIQAWIGVALLAGSWLLGLEYFYPASPWAWLAGIVAAIVLLGKTNKPLAASQTRLDAIALILLLPVVWYAAWPYRAAPLLIVLGLTVRLCRFMAAGPTGWLSARWRRA